MITRKVRMTRFPAREDPQERGCRTGVSCRVAFFLSLAAVCLVSTRFGSSARPLGKAVHAMLWPSPIGVFF